MSTETKVQSGKSFTIIKLLIYGSLGVCISWVSLMIIFGNFVEINPNLYARTFMVWRSNGGDASMFEGRYKGYKINDYEESKQFSEFLDFAQLKGGYIIGGNYPIHAPREPEYLYTLIDEKKAVYELWKVEFNFKALLNGMKTEEERKKFRDDAIKAMKDKTYEKNYKLSWFVGNSKISAEDIKDAFIVDGKPSIWWNAAPIFLNILDKLAKKEVDYNFKGNKVSDRLLADIKEMLEALEYNDGNYENEINSFFKNMGTVKASPFETFLYSRFFNLYTFLTINHDFDYKKESKDPKKKDESNCKEKAEIFAHIFSNVYAEPFDYKLPNPSWKEKFTNFFGPSQDISKVTADQKVNILSSLETARNNINVTAED